MATVPANLVGMTAAAATAALITANLRVQNALATKTTGGALDGGVATCVATDSKPIASAFAMDGDYVILNMGRGMS